MTAWIAAAIIILSHASSHHHRRDPRLPDRPSAVRVSKRVFGRHWRAAVCIARFESRWTLRARNGVNLGPWQINTVAHPGVRAGRLTHSWLYSARVAYAVSSHGTDWTPWTTHGACGV